MKVFNKKSILNANKIIPVFFVSLFFSCTDFSTGDIAKGLFLTSPKIQNIISQSSTSLQITFSQEMKDSVKKIENYTIKSKEDSLKVSSITELSGSNNKILTLTTSKQSSGFLYTLTVKNIESALGKKVSSKGISSQFSGYSVNLDTADINIKIDNVNYGSGGLYSFKNQNIDSKSSPVTFTVENTGTQDLIMDLDNLTLEGGDASMFSLVKPSQSIVKPSESTDFTLVFQPTSPGEKNLTLKIVSNDPDEENYLIFITAGVNDPIMLADMDSSVGSYPSNLTVFDNKLFFSASNYNMSNSELWVYDYSKPLSTDYSTSDTCSNNKNPCLLADLNSTTSSFPSSFYEYNNKLFFQAASDNYGRELFIYDSSKDADNNGNDFGLCADNDNPCIFADLNSGANSSSPANFQVYNNILYFAATNSSYGTELWLYDASKSVTDNADGFSLCTDNDNPCIIADIQSGSSGSNPGSLTVYNNKLYFIANDTLYVYDDTKAVLDNNSDGYTYCSTGDNPCQIAGIYTVLHLTVYHNKLYFSSSTVSYSSELTVYDPSKAVTNEISGPYNLCSSGGNPCIIADISSSAGSNPSNFYVFHNKLYFSASANNQASTELWLYDDSKGISDNGNGYNLCSENDNPCMLKDLNNFSDGQFSAPESFISFQDKLFFSASNELYGTELWLYDDSKELSDGSDDYNLLCSDGDNPCIIRDIFLGVSNADVQYITEYNNKLFFQANTALYQNELWMYVP